MSSNTRRWMVVGVASVGMVRGVRVSAVADVVARQRREVAQEADEAVRGGALARGLGGGFVSSRTGAFRGRDGIDRVWLVLVGEGQWSRRFAEVPDG